jgi:integrase
MARTVRNAKLDSRSARSKLPARREPYWVVISKGCGLGYRKGTKGGTWISRYRDDIGKQHYNALGAADDAMDSDGTVCLTYAEAQRTADGWFKVAASGFKDESPRSGPYLVKDAMADYIADYQRRGGKSLYTVQSVINAHIIPALGDIPVAKLTRRRIEQWQDELSKAPPMVRTRPGEPQKRREMPSGIKGERQRKSSSNRVLTALKAALNHAYDSRKVASDEAWRPVKAYREVDAVRIRYLNDDESRRLVNASDTVLRPLVQAALLTGCRYGELCALVVTDYNPDAGTLHIRISKSGKPRHVVLTDEGRIFFDTATAGKKSDDMILTREDGEPWAKSHQQRPFKAACKNAKIGDMTFHELRHTYASRLVMNGAPLPVVAAQLGHSDTRMVEKHYGHMSANYIADTVRATFGTMGVVEPSNIKRLPV